MNEPYSTHVPNRFAAENTFRETVPDADAPPQFSVARDLLPEPIWPANPDAIAAYWRAWEIAFGNLRQPMAGSGFVANFIDPAFNGNIFMWDSAFMLEFGRYGRRAFDFQRSLDNFYAKQHPDGFICREIRQVDGSDCFTRFDPTSTGPNVLAWCEWEHYQQTCDRARLERVFPILVAYHQFCRKAFSWPDGAYFSSGWGCGMDNQPRLPEGFHEAFDHGHMTWIDSTLQAALSARTLGLMARVLGRETEIQDLRLELEHLTDLANKILWDDRAGFYVDRFHDGRLSGVKSIGAFWALLAGVATESRAKQLVAQLEDPRSFNRPHRVPTLSADHPGYDPAGHYWRGSVWAPTNFMVLRGLTAIGQDDLAYAIACNHLDQVMDVFAGTGTFWENYAPEFSKAGSIARPEFVGWTGLPPIAVLLEYVFGLRPDVAHRRILWDLRLTEEHGVRRYPFARSEVLDLHCAARQSSKEEPQVRVRAPVPVEVDVRWDGGHKLVRSEP